METEPADPFGEKLASLPHRALVALAARCAWRVSPLLAGLPEIDRAVIEDAIRGAEHLAAGIEISHADLYTAYESVRALTKRLESHLPIPGSLRGSSRGAWQPTYQGDEATILSASRVCEIACAFASMAASSQVANGQVQIPTAVLSLLTLMGRSMIEISHQAFNHDADILMSLNLGQSGAPGDPVDTGEAGPMGFLWPDGEPDWSHCRFGR